MNSRTHKVCALLVCLLAVSVSGCFGDNILSATSKVLGGQMSTLTAGEIQILNELAIAFLSSQNPGFEPVALNAAQAQALANFLAVNNINTIEDFEAIAQAAETDPSSIQGLEELAVAFAGTETDELDPENLDPEDLNEIFLSIFGGVGVSGGTGGGEVVNGEPVGGAR